MATITREQLVRYIKGLEAKVKQYQQALRARDTEISKLKNELVRFIKDEKSGMTLSVSADDPSPAAEQVQSQQATPSIVPKPMPVDLRVVAPLEENSKTYVQKPAIGVNESLKEAIRQSTRVEETIRPEMEEDVPESVEIEEKAVSNEDEALPDWIQKDVTVESIAVPAINFKAGEFLGAVLESEEDADEMKLNLQRLAAAEQDQRRNILLSLTSLHWRMIAKMAKRIPYEDLTWEKRLFMRYGMLDESLMSERMDVWQQLYLDRSQPEESGIYYIDEWLEAVYRGDHRYSSIDEMALDGRKPDSNASGETALGYEIISVPQMQRMAVGARANLISILVQEYCAPSRDNPVITRKWLQSTVKQFHKCDTLLFYRKYKGEDVEVQPIFIVTPGYGQKAGCWEPFTPGRKGTTGPRICISILPPRSSYRALLMGLADYRWEYAKADAMHYWLTEGLTGKWIALFNRKEQRKDLKEIFIDCYFHWCMNESRRIPKIEKRFRDFFWINVPFGEEIKQTLKGGGMFGRLVELEEAKKKRDEEERIEIERIKAEREARKSARKQSTS